MDCCDFENNYIAIKRKKVVLLYAYVYMIDYM